MTESTPFPTSPYCQVRARVASIWADGPDDGVHPDWRPAVGEKVVLTPSIGSQLLTYDVGGDDPIIVTVERVDCVVGADGLLTTGQPGRPVYIAPTDDPLLSATGWTWTATIKGKSVVFSAPSGGVADLALFVAAPATGDTQSWVERIPELIAVAGSLGTGGSGSAPGVVPIFETRAQAEAWEAAIPGRIALTIESPDTVNPTWTATLTVATLNGGTAVITASALATDDRAVVGYDYSIGGVTWTPITPAGRTFTITGFTSETTYSTVLLRARDAWDNFATLAVPTFTTPDTLAPAPTDYVYRWLGADITATSWTDTEAGLVLTKGGVGVPSVEDGAAVYPGNVSMSAASAPLLTAPDATYVYAYKLDDAETPGFLSGDNNGVSYVLVSPEYGSLVQIGTWKGATNPPTPPADTNWHVVVVRWAGANTVRITLDGTTRLVAPRNTTGLSHNPLYIGGANAIRARFKEAQFFNRSLSDGEVASVTDDLKTKYGI